MIVPPNQIGPPPAQGDVAQQQPPQQGPGAFGQQAAQQQQPGGPNGSDPGASTAKAGIIKDMLTSLMSDEPALTPFLQHALNDLETGIRTVFSQRLANQQASMPGVTSNTPPSEPGAGLPPM